MSQPTPVTIAKPGEGSEVDLEALKSALDYIRPAVQADGGDIVLKGVEGGRVELEMVGACGGCPLSMMTLKAGIERILTDRVPGVTEVIAVSEGPTTLEEAATGIQLPSL
ncbi:MAG: NifU family protein [Actinomycetes bacterium]|jgi:Fe-S cluster biogenesis protein NfuA|nr:MAG: nitrogen fixation protein [Actinomycetota bacterium]